MIIDKVNDYEAFAALVEKMGFMPFANNKVGYPNLDSLTDNEWHTGEETDPWRWRVRIERDHRALFGKFFFGNPGFISTSRIADFASVRRNGLVFDELYFDGVLPRECKPIYDAIEDEGVLAVHEIKTICRFDKSSNAKFESAMKAMQMYMLITISGQKRKFNKRGEEYGWPSNAFSTLETWVGGEVEYIDYGQAKENILDTMKIYISEFDEKKAGKMIGGIRG
ncbi:MAG: hypothetical protein HN948_02225 [Clostridia bacterium]|jgi:hypothetical protein|nr:hypothetical protein [Clostridia bacterium]MBT7121807.1 hypothetical protein [Clostridia bacterium]